MSIHVKRTCHDPQARPVARSSAALQSGGFASASAGSSPGSWRFRKNRSARSWTRSAPSSPSGISRSTSSSWSASNRSASCCSPDEELSEQRRLLIGSYFLAEYSLESAALFNPSIVPHPDQTGSAARRAAVHSQPARHRRRTHFLHHVSNRHHPSRSADRGIHPHRLPHRAAPDSKSRLREGAVRAKARRTGIDRRIHAPGHGQARRVVRTGRASRRSPGRTVPPAGWNDAGRSERRPGNLDAGPVQLRSSVPAGTGAVGTHPLPGHAVPAQRHRGRPLRLLPERRRHPHLLRDLHRLRRQGRDAGTGGDF